MLLSRVWVLSEAVYKNLKCLQCSLICLLKSQVLRSQLQHLKGFIFTCKDPIAEEVRRRIWPREYLWDDIHQYSLLVSSLLVLSLTEQWFNLFLKIVTFFLRFSSFCVACAGEQMCYFHSMLVMCRCVTEKLSPIQQTDMCSCSSKIFYSSKE